MKLSPLFIAGIYAGEHHRNLKQHNQEKEETLSDLPPPNYEQENTEKYWRDLTRQQILESIAKTPNMKKAKNVILFIGDGMGYPSQTAGRILAGGEEYDTAIDKMPWSGSVKTYNIDHQTPDSAGTATAYLCGVKANFYTAGLSGEGKFKQCETAESSKVESVLKKAKKAGKGTGIVTTTRINHASPSGAYAHTNYRMWYSDKDIAEDEDLTDEEKNSGLCIDIAKQFDLEKDPIDIAFGGGWRYFCPKEQATSERDCKRLDGDDILAKWKADSEITYIETRQELEELLKKEEKIDNKIIGLFSDYDLEYEVDRERNYPNEPSLTDMTEFAVKELSKEENGFYLFVEGGRIDHAHHDNQPIRALYDFIEFDNAIAKAVEMTDPEETLILISADHSHQFSIGGYGVRRTNVFGLGDHKSGEWPEDNEKWDTDDENVFVLNYADGPGFKLKEFKDEKGQITHCGRVPPADFKNEWSKPLEHTGTEYPGTAYSSWSSHGGEDVSLQGSGPWAHLVTGVHEQTFVAGLTEFAMCIGDYQNEPHCITSPDDSGDGSAGLIASNIFLALYLLL